MAQILGQQAGQFAGEAGRYQQVEKVVFALEIVVPRLSPLPRQVEKERVPLAGTWTFNGKHDIEVPGEWVMQGFEVEKGKEALYERTFNIPARWEGQRVKLRCNGIYSESRICINGKEVDSHLGGFTAFELEEIGHS